MIDPPLRFVVVPAFASGLGPDFAKVLAEDLAAKGDIVKRAGIKPNAN